MLSHVDSRYSAARVRKSHRSCSGPQSSGLLDIPHHNAVFPGGNTNLMYTSTSRLTVLQPQMLQQLTIAWNSTTWANELQHCNSSSLLSAYCISGPDPVVDLNPQIVLCPVVFSFPLPHSLDKADCSVIGAFARQGTMLIPGATLVRSTFFFIALPRYTKW